MNTLNQNKSKKFATGWLIVVACMLIQAIPFGVASNIQPQFVSYVVEEKGFTGFVLVDGRNQNELNGLEMSLDELNFWPSIMLHAMIRSHTERKYYTN